jgi:hypothetical protein
MTKSSIETSEKVLQEKRSPSHVIAQVMSLCHGLPGGDGRQGDEFKKGGDDLSPSPLSPATLVKTPIVDLGPVQCSLLSGKLPPSRTPARAASTLVAWVDAACW